MTSAEQSGEPLRDFSSSATWGDVEHVRTSLDAKIDTQIAEVKAQMAEMETRLVTRIAEAEATLGRRMGTLETRVGEVQAELAGRMGTLETRMDTQLAQLETRLTRLFLGAIAGGVAVLGVLFGILQAVD